MSGKPLGYRKEFMLTVFGTLGVSASIRLEGCGWQMLVRVWREEIDLVGKGKNYGWNIMEGSLNYSGGSQRGIPLPVWEYESQCGHRGNRRLRVPWFRA